MRRAPSGRRVAVFACTLVLMGTTWAGPSDESPDDESQAKRGHAKSSRISDESVALVDPESFPERPRPFLELGNPFLGTRTLRPGITLPTGAVWQPSLIAFGSLRSAVQTYDDGFGERSEWANRLDLFANLQLTGTERLVLGFRPLDEDGRFSGYDLRGSNDGSVNAFNSQISALFFEGELGELFPRMDNDDFRSLDLGFALGRQALGFQDGMLIDDTIDAVGVIRNTLLPRGGSDLQFTFVYGWNDIHRGNNVEDDGAQLIGIFSQADYPKSTQSVDVVYVFNTRDGNDGLAWGMSSVQRLGRTNSSFRVLGSRALDRETPAISDGLLLFSELSWVPAWTHNLVYLNAFWGIDRFTSAARGPATGGPLGRTGILFAAPGIGSFGSALGNRPEGAGTQQGQPPRRARLGAALNNSPDDSAGFALGYQIFSHDTRRQFVFELAGRTDTDGRNDSEAAIGASFQQALGQHFVLRVNVFGSTHEVLEDGWGSRLEMLYVF